MQLYFAFVLQYDLIHEDKEPEVIGISSDEAQEEKMQSGENMLPENMEKSKRKKKITKKRTFSEFSDNVRFQKRQVSLVLPICYYFNETHF